MRCSRWTARSKRATTFKGSISKVELDGEKLTLHSDDEYRLTALRDVLESKLIKRGVDIKFLDYGKIVEATKATVRQEITLKSGIPTDKAKQITKLVKDKGLKATTQIMDGQVRITSKVQGRPAIRPDSGERRGLRLPGAVCELSVIY